MPIAWEQCLGKSVMIKSPAVTALSNAAPFPEPHRVIELSQNRNAEMTIYPDKYDGRL
jgi:hypothetical protein